MLKAGRGTTQTRVLVGRPSYKNWLLNTASINQGKSSFALIKTRTKITGTEGPGISQHGTGFLTAGQEVYPGASEEHLIVPAPGISVGYPLAKRMILGNVFLNSPSM